MRLQPEEIEQLEQEIKDGYIIKSKHPCKPLTIYNYSQKTQFERHWNKITLVCRGLVLDDEYNVIIPCVPKFFNLDEPEAAKIDFQNHITKISEKLDGYYISIKKDSKYGLIITSRGSFENKYVDKARELISLDQALALEKDYSYFCELCANFEGDESIIVARHGKPRLVCWAMKDEIGQEIIPSKICCPFESIRFFSYKEAEDYLKNNVEGVVVYDFATRERVKVKTEWYLTIHRLIANCTKKKAWELLKNGQRFELLDIPDEYMKQMLLWKKEIEDEVLEDISEAKLLYQTTQHYSDKEFALSEENPYLRTLVFLLRKNQKDKFRELIFKHHQPKGE